MGTAEQQAAHAAVQVGIHGSAMWWAAAILVGVAALIYLAWKNRAKPEVEDEVAVALRILATPRQVHGGRWVKYKCTLLECEAPRSKQLPRIAGEVTRRPTPWWHWFTS
jgi:hypothetical protein